MVEPAKPFACTIPDCGMSFTNEDHLHVHTKKHDMVLQLGLEQKAAFVADQTPTPTRFIRNCEEVGLFQDLQNVAANPFDEGFKRAMETKPGILSLEATVTSLDDTLHTPHFPLLETAEATLFTNNQRNVTISRSSSDETGAIKEFETRTISKLTNEVTTISRFGNDDVTIKQTETQSDVQTVSYKNNVITIESNVVKKNDPKIPLVVHPGKEVSQIDNSKIIIDKIPIMSQKSIDLVVDNFTTELISDSNNLDVKKGSDINPKLQNNFKGTKRKITEGVENGDARAQTIEKLPKILPATESVIKSEIDENFEVHIKLPSGKSLRMAPVIETVESKTTSHLLRAKEMIRNKIAKKNVNKKTNTEKSGLNNVNNVLTSGTLIPVTLVYPEGNPLSEDDLSKMQITRICNVQEIVHLKTDSKVVSATPAVFNKNVDNCQNVVLPTNVARTLPNTATQQHSVIPIASQSVSKTDCNDSTDDCYIEMVDKNPEQVKRTKMELESRSAASKRYRERLKLVMKTQSDENRRLREVNQRLIAEKAMLKLLITEHMKKCPNASEIERKFKSVVKDTLMRKAYYELSQYAVDNSIKWSITTPVKHKVTVT